MDLVFYRTSHIIAGCATLWTSESQVAQCSKQANPGASQNKQIFAPGLPQRTRTTHSKDVSAPLVIISGSWTLFWRAPAHLYSILTKCQHQRALHVFRIIILGWRRSLKIYTSWWMHSEARHCASPFHIIWVHIARWRCFETHGVHSPLRVVTASIALSTIRVPASVLARKIVHF